MILDVLGSADTKQQEEQRRAYRERIQKSQNTSDLQSPAKSKQPQGGTQSRRRAGNISVNKGMYEELVRKSKELDQLKHDHANLEESYQAALTEKEKMDEDIQAKEETIKDLREKLQDAIDVARENGKGVEAERATDVTDRVKEFVKTILFRTTKFANTEKALTRATRAAYEDACEMEDLNLDEDNFIRIYSGVVSQELNYRRAYVQSQCKAACEGK